MAALVAVVSTVFAGKLQTFAGTVEADKVSALQTLLVTIGGSLVGATAIVSTMVFYLFAAMFAPVVLLWLFA